jgi:myo-inositol 2-dehydrogenase/D-chiro-inositol 1-dehydrogenase
MLAAFRDGGEPPVHARAGRRALALALATIRSFETGTRVPTPPDAEPAPSAG